MGIFSCSMRTVKKVWVPFGKGESCQWSVTVVEHSKGYKIATRKVWQVIGSMTVLREVRKVLERWVSYGEVCWLWGRCKEVWKGVTVVRKCDRRFVSLWWGVMVMGRGKRAWGGASLDRKCDSHQGGVKGIKNECQLMERCDGHGV